MEDRYRIIDKTEESEKEIRVDLVGGYKGKIPTGFIPIVNTALKSIVDAPIAKVFPDNLRNLIEELGNKEGLNVSALEIRGSLHLNFNVVRSRTIGSSAICLRGHYSSIISDLVCGAFSIGSDHIAVKKENIDSIRNTHSDEYDFLVAIASDEDSLNFRGDEYVIFPDIGAELRKFNSFLIATEIIIYNHIVIPEVGDIACNFNIKIEGDEEFSLTEGTPGALDFAWETGINGKYEPYLSLEDGIRALFEAIPAA